MLTCISHTKARSKAPPSPQPPSLVALSIKASTPKQVTAIYSHRLMNYKLLHDQVSSTGSAMNDWLTGGLYRKEPIQSCIGSDCEFLCTTLCFNHHQLWLVSVAKEVIIILFFLYEITVSHVLCRINIIYRSLAVIYHTGRDSCSSFLYYYHVSQLAKHRGGVGEGIRRKEPWQIIFLFVHKKRSTLEIVSSYP